jgi:signal transduction histidine kinase
MGSVMSERPARKRRTVGIAVGATLLLVILVVGLAFANSIGAGRVADNARSLHWANASLGTAALTRSALVQAATFVELEESGLVGHDDVAAAMGDASDAHDRLAVLRDLGGESPSMPFLIHFIAPVGQSLQALGTSDYEGAKHLIMTDVEDAYLDLVGSLQTEQDNIQAAIDANTAGAARMTDFVRFFLTLAIPAAAVLIYRSFAKRQVREHQIKADLEIEAEREVGRAKDEFIAGLSHELRTPLTSIYGFAEVLTDSGGDAETTHELSQIIANEAAEMTRMVDDLLAAARIESTGVEIEMKPIRVSDVVESAITPFERAGLTIKRFGSDTIVETDAARLRHVIINLLSNAARHGGDSIGIEVSAGDGVVDIEVWDNGPGVAEDQVEKLFDRFVHNGEAPLLTGSLGLGLAIASRLTAMLGGRLSYQRFARKTYFTITLPTSEEISSALEQPIEPVAAVIRALTA